MKTVTATDAKQRLVALLDAAQREPVLIRRQNRDVAVIMSAEEYERIRRSTLPSSWQPWTASVSRPPRTE
jgi:prevent-host-death family protein